MKRTKDALEILGTQIKGDGALDTQIQNARLNFQVAQMIYDARINAGLSQAQLAAIVGTRQPAIARLEDADYRGHSLTMLQRIASALNQELEIRFVSPAKPAQKDPAGSRRSRAKSTA